MNVTLEEVQKMARLQLGLRKISPDDRFMEDLGAVSADMVNLVATAEEQFNVSFDEEDLAGVRCVRDLYDLIINTAN
ncbi:MAG: acyl carrier protein [bacterium]|nr:acyl carrier protein [bacterium]